MESQYRLEVTEFSCSYGLYEGREDMVRAAVRRIQDRIRTGNTLVIVRVNNPRYKGQ